MPDTATPPRPNLHGRLGDPDMTLATDPRSDPRMVAVLEPMGLAGRADPVSLTADSSLEDIRALAALGEPGFQQLFDGLFDVLPAVEGVESSTEAIAGVDGNDITLYIHRPAGDTGPCPGILHIHGGGMVILSAADLNYRRWRDELAAREMVVVGVEFRNAAGALGSHPFPAALNDCTSALEWMHARKDELGVSKLVVSGESGGGNLTLATALKAHRDGRLGMIDGVFAQCPYISGTYASPPPELPSLHENGGYFLAGDLMGYFVEAYDPGGANLTNPLAWPWHASVDDLRGMPPHVVSVNELDPLRDEGLDYYRKLVRAGVPTYCRTVNGTCHAGDLLMPGAMPDVYAASARDLATFAHTLC
ncbi:MAG: alpha/beta hydrolase fold domain-containing protein [Acidimicrobiaceae bacterium]|nr:alpha/beta hydrolase fold domain-containing protein [Acidimicrobiaceae bacterium]